MTDISGFGLSSHLIDICKFSNLSARLKLNEDCLINTNFELLKKYKSTGFENNYEASYKFLKSNLYNKFKNILFDPQTNGPLLMVIDKSKKDFFEKRFIEYNESKPILIGNFESNLEKQSFIYI